MHALELSSGGVQVADLQTILDLGVLVLVTRCDASLEKARTTSLSQAPDDSTIITYACIIIIIIIVIIYIIYVFQCIMHFKC